MPTANDKRGQYRQILALRQNATWLVDVFFGVDYHSHLGTKNAGMVFCGGNGTFHARFTPSRTRRFALSSKTTCTASTATRAASAASATPTPSPCSCARTWAPYAHHHGRRHPQRRMSSLTPAFRPRQAPVHGHGIGQGQRHRARRRAHQRRRTTSSTGIKHAQDAYRRLAHPARS